MAVQLQVRNRYAQIDTREHNWTCDGETKRNEPTKFMKETAGYYRREQKDYEVRFVYDKTKFV